jgi:uncharacterized protein (TIGR00661 family)
MSGKRVLVAPLDWGLGHATRCIPVIKSLQQRGCEVFIASSGSALALLKKEFPDLKFFSLPSYRIKYPKSGSFVFSMVKQIPKIKKTIAKENERVQKIIIENDIELIISDNRYGCWSENIPSVIICHQLSIQLPFGWSLLKPVVDLYHQHMIKRFKQCWIPDDRSLNLTGELSVNRNLTVKQIGILSRFKKANAECKYDVAVVLSGPEPQRSILEGVIFAQVRTQNLRAIIVRGVVEGEGNWRQEGNVTTVNFLQSAKLEEIINQSNIVISRSGYSTIMDLARLGKKAILIPTPGQTEQEYLADRLLNNGICYTVSQANFNLADALTKCTGFSGFSNIESENELLSQALDDVLK